MSRLPRRWLLAAGAVVLASFAVLGAAVMSRPSTTGTTPSGVVVECEGLEDRAACIEWGVVVLEAGPPARVFEIEDVARLRLVGTTGAPGAACRADWFLGRYPDDVAATGEVPCPAG